MQKIDDHRAEDDGQQYLLANQASCGRLLTQPQRADDDDYDKTKKKRRNLERRVINDFVAMTM